MGRGPHSPGMDRSPWRQGCLQWLSGSLHIVPLVWGEGDKRRGDPPQGAPCCCWTSHCLLSALSRCRLISRRTGWGSPRALLGPHQEGPAAPGARAEVGLRGASHARGRHQPFRGADVPTSPSGAPRPGRCREMGAPSRVSPAEAGAGRLGLAGSQPGSLAPVLAGNQEFRQDRRGLGGRLPAPSGGRRETASGGCLPHGAGQRAERLLGSLRPLLPAGSWRLAVTRLRSWGAGAECAAPRSGSSATSRRRRPPPAAPPPAAHHAAAAAAAPSRAGRRRRRRLARVRAHGGPCG